MVTFNFKNHENYIILKGQHGDSIKRDSRKVKSGKETFDPIIWKPCFYFDEN